MATRKTSSTAKAGVKKRTLNPAGAGRTKTAGAPFQETDPKRRLGNFQTAGEHARVGGRRSGIVGQNTKRFATDGCKRKK